MSFFGNFGGFGGGFGRPSWSSLGINMGDSGSGGMIVGGNMGPFGSGITHGTLAHVAQPSLASTLLNTPTVVGHMMTSPARAIAESFYPKIDLPSITPSFMTAPHVGMSTLPTMELGERLPISVPSMEMRPDAIASIPSAPAVAPAVEKSGATPPAQEVANSVSANGPIETAAPKQSFMEHVKHAFSHSGDFVADENPIILPDGTKDYLMGNDVQEKAAIMEGKVAATAALAIPVVRQGYAMGKLIAKGAEAVIEAAESGTPGGLTFATPNGATLAGALEAVPSVAGEGAGAGIITAAAVTGNDFPLSMSLKQEKVPGQRDIGSTGSSTDLNKGTGPGGFLDRKEVHHIVPQRYLKKHEVNPDDGLSVVLPNEIHGETSTYKGKAKNFDLDQSFRDATAKGARDVIRLEKEHGIYEGGGRKNLLEGLKKDKEKRPELYKKGTTK